MIKKLKALRLNETSVNLVAVKKTLRNREGHYTLKYVETDKSIGDFLKQNAVDQIKVSSSISEFTFDSTQPSDEEMMSLDSKETEFDQILEQLKNSNPEDDKATEVQELFKTNFYIAIFRNKTSLEIELIGIKRIPESWDLRKKNEVLRRIFFKEERFHDLTEEHVFSLSKKYDAFYFKDKLLVLSRNNFEVALNFREGMKNKAENLYESLSEVDFIKNLEEFKKRCGDNLRYLRKLSTIYNLGLYKKPEFQEKVLAVSKEDGWDIDFEDNRIVINDANFESVLYILENKRLFSKLTLETKDVDGKAETKKFKNS